MSASAERTVSRLCVVPRELDPFGDNAQPDLAGLAYIGSNGHADAYARPDLAEEIAVLRGRGSLPDEQYVYHVTNSTALPYVAAERALLSSRRQLELGRRPVSGEIVQRGVPLDDPSTALEDIYASDDPLARSYDFTPRGHHPITFGLARAALGIPAPRLLDEFKDGIRLGPAVPLSAVGLLTTDHSFVPDLKAWSVEYCDSEPTVMSSEAAVALSAFHRER